MFGLGIARRARSIVDKLTPKPSITRNPADPISWVIEANRRMDTLSPRTQARIKNHELTPTSPSLQASRREISRRAGPRLIELSHQQLSPKTIELAIDEIIQWMTIAHCARAKAEVSYFDEAEADMPRQWNQIIWPIIKNEDFTHVLDLACGHGRNTEMLRHLAQTIDMVDVNDGCLKISRNRFGDQMAECRFRYHLTDGNGLPGITDRSVSFVYSWDSMVHFDRLAVRSYMLEIARVLESGGSAFLHTSNYGALAPNSDWTRNHGNRSDMTADLLRQFAENAGFVVKFQRLSGKDDGRGIDDLDCLTLLSKA
jgi:ubiquinone/menaquinone biosynthesis C-methylase UbiE